MQSTNPFAVLLLKACSIIRLRNFSAFLATLKMNAESSEFMAFFISQKSSKPLFSKKSLDFLLFIFLFKITLLCPFFHPLGQFYNSSKKEKVNGLNKKGNLKREQPKSFDCSLKRYKFYLISKYPPAVLPKFSGKYISETTAGRCVNLPLMSARA